jgi:hypothetical protein
MSLVKLKDVKIGMKIAKSITNDNGIVLMNEGTTLTDKIIERLGQWGITALHVQDEEEILSPEEIDLRKKEIVDRFQDVSGDEFMVRIRDIVLKQFEEKYQVKEQMEEEH